MVAKRRWGYLVWVVAGAVVAVPELTASIDGDALPFTTISAMVGHLERHHDWVELIVIAVIVFVVLSTIRVPPKTESGGARSGDEPGRTPGGRLTLRASASAPPTAEFDDEDAPALFAAAALVSFTAVAIATWAAVQWWDDARHYQPAYVLYGLIALLWVVVPSILAFAWGKDFPFPTLFRTIANLEDWLKQRTWPHRLGPVTGWLVAYLILTGLVILLLHLTLYPFPSITKILNPTG